LLVCWLACLFAGSCCRFILKFFCFSLGSHCIMTKSSLLPKTVMPLSWPTSPHIANSRKLFEMPWTNTCSLVTPANFCEFVLFVCLRSLLFYRISPFFFVCLCLCLCVGCQGNQYVDL
jgi:hypothetical protein